MNQDHSQSQPRQPSNPLWVAAKLLIALLLCLVPAAAISAEQMPKSGEKPVEARDYRMIGDATRMRLAIQLDREPEMKWFLLRAPYRLVIDLPETKFIFDAGALKPHGLISGVRFGHLDQGSSRLIISTNGPFTVDKLDLIENEKDLGLRLVADLSAASDAAFESALAEQTETTGSTLATRKSDRLGATAQAPDKRFVVVIDPGHGGIDGGAEGVSGAQEKDVTLTFAEELRGLLTKSGKYEVFMTREKDEFLRLDDRVRIARQHAADLFISVHADTIRLKGVRGATVYTVSDKASDAEAQALADRENLSDQLAGIEIVDEKAEVADILIDLIRRETHTFSIRFARSLVGELSTTVGLINNPHRSAGFKVLRAPDVPSVLLELGYMSNAKDEQQLLSAEWRSKAAASVASAVELFSAARSGEGG